ncbi:LptA/OstA family protein [Natronospora cellulosivora (SeqCode)]
MILIKPFKKNIENWNNRALIYFFILLFIILAFNTSFNVLAETEEGVLRANIISYSIMDGFNVFLGEENAVLISKANDIRLEANLLQYNLDTEDFLAENEVFFKSNDFDLFAGKVNGNLSKRNFEASSNILFKSDDLKIESYLVTYQEEDGILNFSGEVSLIHNEIEAKADKLIYNEIEEKVYLKGNVEGTVLFEQGYWDLSGGLLEINLADGTWSISTNPQISFRE